MLSTSRIALQYAQYAQNLIDLWKEYYPGYLQALHTMQEDQREEHFRRVYIAWACEKLAWELARASQMRWPFRNPYWLDHMLARGVPLSFIARECRVPAALVRMYAYKHGICRPRGLVQAVRWILTGKNGLDEVSSSQDRPTLPITEQCSLGEWIFVRTPQTKIFVPADELFRSEDRYEHAIP